MQLPDHLHWQKICNSGACVEVARHQDMIVMRNAQKPNDGVVFCTIEEWQAFISGAKLGEFDGLL